LQKNTHEQHPDCQNIKQAIVLINKLVGQINSSTKEAENLQDLLRIDDLLCDTPQASGF